MKSRVKKVFKILFLLIIITGGLFAFSLYNPGKLKFIDNIRIPLQAKVMATVGDYLVGDVWIDNGEIIEGPEIISLEEVREYADKLAPGSIFLTDSERYVSSEFIDGKWKHAGIYLGKKDQIKKLFGEESKTYKKILPYYKTGEEQLKIDAGSHGVTIGDISKLSNLTKISYIKGFTAFKINIDNEKIKNFIKISLTHLGKNYDYDMITDDDKDLYCSELVYESLKNIGIKYTSFSEKMGRKIVMPQDAFKDMIADTKIFTQVFELSKLQHKLKDKLSN
ncbi:MAG: YiiX/YebB-like N1pC/P60 family cysteine hydrolase [Candidatus Gracilibacteria bacterium]|nr:YiiX/YebB-like N1pC/P60 family cysteine hydrolase [Candidatus Gracilibacteria bacterium]